jgi:hypothetical protein
MPRPIIGVPKIHITSREAQSTSSVRIGLREPQLGKRLREKRSLTYVETFSRIDVAGYQSNKDALDSLLRTISNEFPELSIDLSGEIIEHFETHRPMAAPFERARCLALHPSYAFIEIFKDTLRAVFLDGAVSVITP